MLTALDHSEPVSRKFELVVFDVDGTLTPAFSIWEHIHKELRTWYISDGGKDLLGRYLRGEIDYFKFCELDALVWEGESLDKIHDIVNRVSYNCGVSETLTRLKELDYNVALVSTGLTVLTDRIHREFGLDFSVANHLIDQNGILSGQVAINVPDVGKGEVFTRISRLFNVRPGRSIAVGDSRGDVPMFNRAGRSVLYVGSETTNSDIKTDFAIASGDLSELLTILEA